MPGQAADRLFDPTQDVDFLVLAAIVLLARPLLLDVVVAPQELLVVAGDTNTWLLQVESDHPGSERLVVHVIRIDDLTLVKDPLVTTLNRDDRVLRQLDHFLVVVSAAAAIGHFPILLGFLGGAIPLRPWVVSICFTLREPRSRSIFRPDHGLVPLAARLRHRPREQ